MKPRSPILRSFHVPMTNIRPRTITQISSALIPSPPFRDYSRTVGGADRAPDQISVCLTRVSSLPEIRASACTVRGRALGGNEGLSPAPAAEAAVWALPESAPVGCLLLSMQAAARFD